MRVPEIFGANVFNLQVMQEKLPNTRELSDAGQAMLPQMGGSVPAEMPLTARESRKNRWVR